MQANINAGSIPFAVINAANNSGGYYEEQIKLMRTRNIGDADVVIFHMSFRVTEILMKCSAGSLPSNIHILDLRETFKRPHGYGEVFFDGGHVNYKGNKVLAGKMFDRLLEIDAFNTCPHTADRPTDSGTELLSSSEEREISEYIAMLAPVKTNIGAIVMNCNPFTLGHRYLIEYAAERCAGLYIFVVEEDKSFFPFADRLELVKKGTADLPNVTILPSGKFIISQRTFAQYSEKEELQDSVIDASFDVALFGQKIAPALNINVRFVGEEPLDNVTRQYNADLRRTLPKYDVDVLIIPRKELDGEVISASRVRKLLEIQDFDGAAKLVPETTLIYLKEKFHYESIGCAAELVDRQDNMDEIESGCKWIHKSKRKIWVERFAEFFGKHTDSDR